MTQVLVTALTPDGWDQAKTGTAQVNPVHDETIAGADRAFATDDGSILAMDVHGRFVQLAYFSGSTDSVLTATKQLAAEAAARMP
jgi:hypothetical protein